MTAPTKPNAELAYRVLDHIDAHPESWNQRRWWEAGCGTRGCFAGWAVKLSGGDMVRHVDEFGIGETVVSAGLGDELVGRPAALVAAKLLRIDDLLEDVYDAEDVELFHPNNDREDLGELVEKIFGPRPCDADAPTLGPDGQCTCLVCSKCGHHTGNSHQGHYWRACKVTGTDREFHFCCPDACELEGGAA